MTSVKEAEERAREDRYPNLHAVPTKQLAMNIVGSLIMAKGNINKWGDLIERFLADYRAEEDASLSLARELAKAGQVVSDMAVSWEPLTPGDISELRAALTKARKAGLLEDSDDS